MAFLPGKRDALDIRRVPHEAAANGIGDDEGGEVVQQRLYLGNHLRVVSAELDLVCHCLAQEGQQSVGRHGYRVRGLRFKLKEALELLDQPLPHRLNTLPIFERWCIRDRSRHKQIAEVSEFVRRHNRLEGLDALGKEGEGLLVLAALNVFQILLFVHRIQKTAVVAEHRLGAQLFHFGPVALKQRLPHALDVRLVRSYFIELHTGLILQHNLRCIVALILQILHHHPDNVLLNLLVVEYVLREINRLCACSNMYNIREFLNKTGQWTPSLVEGLSCGLVRICAVVGTRHLSVTHPREQDDKRPRPLSLCGTGLLRALQSSAQLELHYAQSISIPHVLCVD
eukprot:Opistho-2@86489